MDYVVSTDPAEVQQLISEGSLSHAQIADTLAHLRQQGYSPDRMVKIAGVKDYTVRQYYVISKKLVPPVKELLHKNRITFSHARSIAAQPVEDQEEIARRAIMTGMSVSKMRDKIGGNSNHCDEETLKYYERLRDAIAVQTGFILEITPDISNKHAGTMTIRYTDLRDFDAICDRLNVDLSEY